MSIPPHYPNKARVIHKGKEIPYNQILPFGFKELGVGEPANAWFNGCAWCISFHGYSDVFHFE